MHVSPRFTSEDWQRLTFQAEDDWRQAVEMLHDRIRQRFLDPISRIEPCAYAGFAVLALDCLLIEMLQQFREGVNKTPSGKSKLYFVRYLTETGFGDHFTDRMAELFYRQIRCGILHQAEVRGSSRILLDDDIPLVEYTDDENGLVVNRKAFHETLVREFEKYAADLLEPSNDDLRAKFRKKMTAVCKTACEIV
ncbi:MAG TPA: hypothetical protein VMY05_06025 [Acidobacteriota bacterium]|nr:hypothetical protein [Acidobacteriota bacterium]